jgi:hypothetical protein
MLSLVSLCPAVFLETFLRKWKFSSMFHSNLDLPLNTKKVYHNITELLPKFGNFWGHRFRVMNFDSQPQNFTPWFYAWSFRVPAYLAPCANGCPEIHLRKDQTISNPHQKSCGKLETFSSGLCMQHSFIVMKTDPCTRACIWFWHLSLIPDVCPQIHGRW